MATLFVYSKSKNDFYTLESSLFGFHNHMAWTDEVFLNAAEQLCSRFELKPLRCFMPVQPSRSMEFSRHYGGIAGDFALTAPCKNPIARQNEIRRWCVHSGLFSYVQPQYRTPTWIHAEVDIAPPASVFVPYPLLFPGNSGVYCFILQRCLNIAGFPCLMSGRFCQDTLSSLKRFRYNTSLSAEEWVDGMCWQKLAEAVKNVPQI